MLSKKNLRILFFFLIICLFLTPSVSQAKVLTLKLGHANPQDHHYGQTAIKFVDLVKDKSDGQIEIKIFPLDQLGKGKSQIEAVKQGKIDFTIQYSGFMAQYLKDFGILSIPYAFNSWNQFYKFLNSKYVEQWKKELEKEGFKMLGFIPNGYYLYFTKKTVRKIEDLKGIKFRGKPATKYGELFDKVHGTTSTPVAYGELYSSLQLGVIDGLVQNVSNIRFSKLYEIANCLVARINGMMAVNPLYMSMKTYNKLSEKERKIITESGEEACKWMQEKYLEIEKDDLKFLEEKDMAIFYPSDEEVTEWYKKGSEIHNLYKEEYNEEVVSYILEEIVK